MPALAVNTMSGADSSCSTTSTVAPASRSVAARPSHCSRARSAVDRHLGVHPRVDLVQHPEVDRRAHEVPPAPGQPGHRTDRIGTSRLTNRSATGSRWPMAADDASQAGRAAARRAWPGGLAALGPAGPRRRPGAASAWPADGAWATWRSTSRRSASSPASSFWGGLHRAGPVGGGGGRPHGRGVGVRPPDRRPRRVALLLLRRCSGCSPSTTTGCRSRRPTARGARRARRASAMRRARRGVRRAAQQRRRVPARASCTASTCSRPAPSTSPSGAGTRPSGWRRSGSSARWTS